MSIDLGYLYCIHVTEQEKLDIDKQVRKNRFELKFAIFFPFLPWPIPTTPFLTVEQIVIGSISQLADDCQEAYHESKVYSEMSSTLSKVSKKIRKDK